MTQTMTPPAVRYGSARTRRSRSVREDFPILAAKAGNAGLAYLDNAATTHKPWPVLHAMTDYYANHNSNVGRGYYRLSMSSTDQYNAARAVVAAAIGAESPQEVIFTRGTTDAVNLLAGTLGRQLVGAGDRVVVTGMEHNSNLLPWRRLCDSVGAQLTVVPVGPAGRVALEDWERSLGPDVKVAAFAHVSNVLGTVNPVREMAAAAHRVGAVVVTDGAQWVPHWPVDVRHLGVDFYCFSGHKVYGPMGTGALYGRHELLRDLPPYQVGGGTVKGVSRDEPVDYVPVPERMEAGTPNVAGAVGLAAALEYLRTLGWAAIRHHDEHLVRGLVASLEDIDRVRVIGDPALEPSGIVSLVVDGIHPYDVGGHLDSLDIAVRCGVHCASAFLDDLGLVGTVRVSFAVYNNDREVQRLRQALQTVRPGPWTLERPTTRFI